MEPLWNRITGSPGRNGNNKKNIAKNQVDLTDEDNRFNVTKSYCHGVIKYLSEDDDRSYFASDRLSDLISILIEVFEEEQKYPTEKNVCTVFFLKQDVLQLIGAKFREFPSGGPLLTSICSLFRVIFDSDQEATFENKELIIGTTVFLQSMNLYNKLNRQGEEDFSQLLFIMASKMKSHPTILTHWFDVLGITNTLKSHGYDDDSGLSHNELFPLFYLLLDFVHHEGKVGEYARTGILYLVDVISMSEVLETWILQSDLCTLMASGLGALYSQLNRGVKKLAAINSGAPPTVSIMANDMVKKSTSTTTSASSLFDEESKECKAHLGNFISYLQFWQDMLTFSKSEKLRKSLIGHFDLLFLRQLLYPSIIWSGDSEGGYSGPLLTILRNILEVLEYNNPLSQLILCYFLGIEKKSLQDYTYLVGGGGGAETENTRDLLYNDENGTVVLTLKDIIFTCLERPKLKLIGLQLLATLIRKYYPYVMGTIFSTTTTNSLLKETPIYLKELSILQGIKVDIEAGSSHMNSYASDIEISMINNPYREQQSERSLYPHELNPDDKFMKKLYEILANFYWNKTEINLALTGVFVELGVCGWISLSWLLNNKNTNSVLSILKQLSDQYQHYSLTIENFNHDLNEFDKNLKMSENLGEAIIKHSIPQDQQQFNQPSLNSSVASLEESDSVSSALKKTVSRISLKNNSNTEALPEVDNNNIEMPLNRLYGNVHILREFIKEVEALVHVRSWLVN